MKNIEQDKINKVISIIENKENKLKKLKIFFMILTLIVISSMIFLFFGKLATINISLKNEDYKIKSKNLSIIPNTESYNVTLNISNKNIKSVINAKKIFPKDNNVMEIEKINAKMEALKTKKIYNVTSNSGFFQENKKLTLNDEVKISDDENNHLNLTSAILNIKNGQVTGKDPLFFGANDRYSYNLSSKTIKIDTESRILYLINSIFLEFINTQNNVTTKLTAKNAKINFYQNQMIFESNVTINHLDYKFFSNKLLINLNNDENKKKKKKLYDNIKNIYAVGNIKLTDSTKTITSQQAIFDNEKSIIIFINKVTILEKGKTIKGDKFIYNIETKSGNIFSNGMIDNNKNNRIEITYDKKLAK